MKVPLELSFRGVRKARDIENLLREKAAKLEQICSYLSGCSVALESPQEHQQDEEPKVEPPLGWKRQGYLLYFRRR